MKTYQLTAPLTPEQIADNQTVGLMPAQAQVSAYASRAHWGSFKTGVFPEDGDTCKYWRFTNSALAAMGESNPTFITVAGRLSAREESSYSHPMWALYGANAVQIAGLCRQYAKEIDARGGIPILNLHESTKEEAARLNVKEGVTIPYPLGVPQADLGPVIQFHIVLFDSGNSGRVVAYQYQEWAAEMASALNVSTPVAPTASTSGPKSPASTVSAPTGRTNIGDSAYIQWQADGTGERFNVNATDGKTVATGVRFKSYQGTIPDGGSWQNFDLTPETLANLVAKIAPQATLRNIVVSTGHATTDLGVHEDQQLVYSRPGGAKKVVRDASLIADRIAGKTPFTPLSTGAADPRDVEIGLELDDVARELESEG